MFILDFFTKINNCTIVPSDHLCGICKRNVASGTVGSMSDEHYHEWVCKFCYYYILEMTHLGKTKEDLFRYRPSLEQLEKEGLYCG